MIWAARIIAVLVFAFVHMSVLVLTLLHVGVGLSQTCVPRFGSDIAEAERHRLIKECIGAFWPAFADILKWPIYAPFERIGTAEFYGVLANQALLWGVAFTVLSTALWRLFRRHEGFPFGRSSSCKVRCI